MEKIRGKEGKLDFARKKVSKRSCRESKNQPRMKNKNKKNRSKNKGEEEGTLKTEWRRGEDGEA